MFVQRTAAPVTWQLRGHFKDKTGHKLNNTNPIKLQNNKSCHTQRKHRVPCATTWIPKKKVWDLLLFFPTVSAKIAAIAILWWALQDVQPNKFHPLCLLNFSFNMSDTLLCSKWKHFCLSAKFIHVVVTLLTCEFSPETLFCHQRENETCLKNFKKRKTKKNCQRTKKCGKARCKLKKNWRMMWKNERAIFISKFLCHCTNDINNAIKTAEIFEFLHSSLFSTTSSSCRQRCCKHVFCKLSKSWISWFLLHCLIDD